MARMKKDTPLVNPGVSHTWVYMGRREGNLGKIYHAFLTHEGKHAYFTKIKARAIGHRYSVQVVTENNSTSILTNSVTYLDDKVDKDVRALRDQWVAEDEIALQTQARMRLEKSKGNRFLTMTLGELRRVAQPMNIRERQALLSIIISQITHPLI